VTTTLADRAVFAVVIPSTNTVVEDEYNLARAPGISFHAGRIFIKDESLDSDAAFEALLADLRLEIGRAIRDVMTAKPDHLVMGMSAETFWGGVQGNEHFERLVSDLSGLPVSTGASACTAALRHYGARRIGVITPYQPVGDEQVRRFFTESGFEVAAVNGLRCRSATSIANVPPATIREAFASVDGPGVDALVQAGTNLPVVKVAAELEKELDKPVLAINAATLWHAYRSNGIEDRLTGFGRLLEEN
jgi:maleate isomerase